MQNQIEQLLKIKSLLEKVLINQTEFEKLKSDILKTIPEKASHKEVIHSIGIKKTTLLVFLSTLLLLGIVCSIVFFYNSRGGNFFSIDKNKVEKKIEDNNTIPIEDNETCVEAIFKGIHMEFDYPIFEINGKESTRDSSFLNTGIGDFDFKERLIIGQKYFIVYKYVKYTTNDKAELLHELHQSRLSEEDIRDAMASISDGNEIKAIFNINKKLLVRGINKEDYLTIKNKIIEFQIEYFKNNTSFDILPNEVNYRSLIQTDVDNDGLLDILFDFNGFVPRFKDRSGNAAWYCGFPFFKNEGSGEFKYICLLDGELNDGTHSPQMNYKNNRDGIICLSVQRFLQNDPNCCPSIERLEKYKYNRASKNFILLGHEKIN
jgi:hypothetical protein